MTFTFSEEKVCGASLCKTFRHYAKVLWVVAKSKEASKRISNDNWSPNMTQIPPLISFFGHFVVQQQKIISLKT